MVQPPFADSQSSHDTRYFMALHSSITRLLHHPLLNCPRPAQTGLGRQCPKILTLHIQLTFSTFLNVPFNDSFSFSPQPQSPRTHNYVKQGPWKRECSAAVPQNIHQLFALKIIILLLWHYRTNLQARQNITSFSEEKKNLFIQCITNLKWWCLNTSLMNYMQHNTAALHFDSFIYRPQQINNSKMLFQAK